MFIVQDGRQKGGKQTIILYIRAYDYYLSNDIPCIFNHI